MERPIDKVISRKTEIDKVNKEIKRRKNISKKTRGKKRTRKPKSKYKKRRKKKVTTTQVAQPPIRLTNKGGDKLEVNITAKERRRKRKSKPKTFAEKRASEIAKTGVADASVLRHGQKVASEVLGYTTQARDPLTLRGGASRYNVAGGVGGFQDVGARYDTKDPQQGIRTPQNTAQTKTDFLGDDFGTAGQGPRSRRRPSFKDNRRGDDDDDDDDDDFQDPQYKPPLPVRPLTKEYKYKTEQERQSEINEKLSMSKETRPRPSWDTGWNESIFGRTKGIHGETQRREPTEPPSARLKPYAEKVLNLPQARNIFQQTQRTPTAPQPEPEPKGVITPLRPVSPDDRPESPDDFERVVESPDYQRRVAESKRTYTEVPKPRKAEAQPRFKPIVRRPIPTSRENFMTGQSEDIEDSEIQAIIKEVQGEPKQIEFKPPPIDDTQPEPEPEPVPRLTYAGKKKPQKEKLISPKQESPIGAFDFVDVIEEEEREDPGLPESPKKPEPEPEPIPPEPQPPIQSTGRGRGRPPGSKNKPKTQPTQEDADDPKTEGRRLLKILKNVLGKTNFTATILDDIGSIEELDILIESVYTDEDDETKDNIRAFWNTRKQLGKTPKE